MEGEGVRFVVGLWVQGLALCPELHPSRFLLERLAVRSVQLFMQRGSLAVEYVASLKHLGLSHGVGIVLGTVLWPDTSITTESVLETLDAVAARNHARENFMDDDMSRFHTLDKVNPLVHVACMFTSFLMLLEATVARFLAVDLLLGTFSTRCSL